MASERVFHARGNFSIDLAADNAVTFELTQMLREHFFCETGNEPLQLAEAAGVAFKMKEKRWFPLSADDGSGQLDGAIVVVHGVVPGDIRLPKRAY